MREVSRGFYEREKTQEVKGEMQDSVGLECQLFFKIGTKYGNRCYGTWILGSRLELVCSNTPFCDPCLPVEDRGFAWAETKISTHSRTRFTNATSCDGPNKYGVSGV